MTYFLKKLKSCPPVIFATIFSNVFSFSLPFFSQAYNKTDNNKNNGHTYTNEAIYSSQCSSLISLENKEILTEEEFEEGQLLHSMIKQIAKYPLEYCDEILLAGSHDEIDGEESQIQ